MFRFHFQTPGEGEHKIMEYIRYLKAQPDYDPNTRHCLYGLDADLIMLGLCTHELRFSLLREEVLFDMLMIIIKNRSITNKQTNSYFQVKFGKNVKRAKSVDETRFYLLHLGLLREYLQLEFYAVKDNLDFTYDIEKIIDDWVLLCFMVGNDFIPHLPNLHIGSNALPILYTTYMDVLPSLGGYINEAGILNLERLEKFMHKLGEVDRDLFRQHYSDLKGFDAKYVCPHFKPLKLNAATDFILFQNNDETFGVDLDTFNPNNTDAADLEELIKNTVQNRFFLFND